MTKSLLPLAGLEDVLRYDADTGLLYWTVHIYRIKKPGDLAGHMNKKGYIEVRYNRKTYQAHRVAWFLHTGEDPGTMQVEHKDNNGTNNKASNLRLATPQENARNKSTYNKDKTTSIYKGVTWSKRDQKWRAQIALEGTTVGLGTYDTELEAHKMYCYFAQEEYGEFANFGENSPFNPKDRQFGKTPELWHRHHAKRTYR